MVPFFSIVIPAYKNAAFLERLLQSISIQTYKNFEVVITDDSPNDVLVAVVETYKDKFPLFYQRNITPLGSPENWNKAIELSKGEWIKIMHGDDWFATENALQVMIDHIKSKPNHTFFYCSFNYVKNNIGEIQKFKNNILVQSLLKKSILNVFYKQKIGNPSCILYKRDNLLKFDKSFIWFVDVDFYLQYVFKHKKITYITDTLINVGISNEQITAKVQNDPKIEIPEAFLLLKKYGVKILKNIFVYDFFWRIFRNLGVNKIEVLEVYIGYKNEYPNIENLINAQAKIKPSLLKNGFISKGFMMIAYIRNRFL